MHAFVTDVVDLDVFDHRAERAVEDDPLGGVGDREAHDVPVVAGDVEAIVVGGVLRAQHRRPRATQRDRSTLGAGC